MQVGEYWDTLAYRDGTPEYNQDAHRQRTIDWLSSARGTATAFDVTTKGAPCVLHARPHGAPQLTPECSSARGQGCAHGSSSQPVCGRLHHP